MDFCSKVNLNTFLSYHTNIKYRLLNLRYYRERKSTRRYIIRQRDNSCSHDAGVICVSALHCCRVRHLAPSPLLDHWQAPLLHKTANEESLAFTENRSLAMFCLDLNRTEGEGGKADRGYRYDLFLQFIKEYLVSSHLWYNFYIQFITYKHLVSSHRWYNCGSGNQGIRSVCRGLQK